MQFALLFFVTILLGLNPVKHHVLAQASPFEDLTRLDAPKFVESHPSEKKIRCGDIITCIGEYGNSGNTISYKLGEPLLSFERCLFLIAVPHAISYKIRPDRIIHGGDKQAPQAGLHVAGISAQSDELISLKLQKPQDVFVEANIVLITIWTGKLSNPLTGVLLHISVETQPAPFQSGGFFFTPKPASTFPLERYENLTAPQLSVWAFLPKNNLLSEDPAANKMYLRFKRHNPEAKTDCRKTYIDFFALTVIPPAAKVYTFRQRLCKDQTDFGLLLTDVSLMIYRGNENYNKSSIEINFSTSPNAYSISHK